jgi:hypothetical protein
VFEGFVPIVVLLVVIVVVTAAAWPAVGHLLDAAEALVVPPAP